MATRKPPFSVGIEEEYHLVDPVTRDLASGVQQPVIEECLANLDADVGNVVPEFLRSQVEIGTAVCHSIAEVREKLSALRLAVAQAARKHGTEPVAASTHPFADWNKQIHTDKERYNVLAEDLQAVARRLLICGMHVHVGIDDDDLRMDLLNQISYFLPHLLVLTTSSPFWRGKNTGLMSYRLAVFDELPRTGLPERFDSWGEYERHVDTLVNAGLFEDATKIWWDIRPHTRFPTLEMRICDIGTRVDDTLTVAAIYACVISMLRRLRRNNQRWRQYSNMLIQENRWLAQRYGYSKGLVDFGIGRVVPYPDLLEEIIELCREDAEELDCVAEVENARAILKRGTSAHMQVKTYEEALAQGADEADALRAVVDLLIKETMWGLESDDKGTESKKGSASG